MPKNLVEEFLNRGAGFLPGLIGIEFLAIEQGRTEARLPIRRELLAPNGYLHAASVIALADTACGFGTIATLPDGASNFTTIELKSNFVGTVTDGAIRCDATCLHRGKKTQVWDAVVKDEASGRVLALFRCTQMLITA